MTNWKWMNKWGGVEDAVVCPILLFIGYAPIFGETGRNKNAVGSGHDISSFSSNGDDLSHQHWAPKPLFNTLVFPEEDENLVNAILFFQYHCNKLQSFTEYICLPAEV